MASKRSYQVQPEQLTEEQWQAFDQLMRLAEELACRIAERKAAMNEEDQR